MNLGCLWNGEEQRATFNTFCFYYVGLSCVHVEGRHAGAIVCRQMSEDILQGLVIFLSDL